LPTPLTLVTRKRSKPNLNWVVAQISVSGGCRCHAIEDCRGVRRRTLGSSEVAVTAFD